jgi:primosomal protein N'
MWIVDIVPLSKGILDKPLSYYSPQKVSLGQLVTIPLRKKLSHGIVVGQYDASTMKLSLKDSAYTLRKISGIHQLFIPPYFLDSAQYVSKYYLTPLPKVLASLLPVEYRNMGVVHGGKVRPLTSKKDARISLPTSIMGDREKRLEHYKKNIKKTLKSGFGVVVILPTQHEAKEWHGIFLDLFPKTTCQLLCSDIPSSSQQEIMEDLSRDNSESITVCTPGFFAPASRTAGLLILENESSQHYTPNTFISFDWRKFFVYYSRISKNQLLLGGDFLSLYAISGKETKQVQDISERAKLHWEAKTFIHDSKKVSPSEKPSLFYKRTLDAIEETLQKDSSVFCFVPRLGYSSITTCQDCKHVFVCEECSSGLLLRTRSGKREFYCKECNKTFPPPELCPVCEGSRFSLQGITLEKVHEYLQERFPKESFFLADKTSLSSKKGQKALSEILYDGGIVLGTSAAIPFAKGKVSLSIISSIDPLAYIPTLEAYEIALGKLLSVAQTATEMTILETRNTPKILSQAFHSKNLSDWYRQETQARKAFSYPPHSVFIEYFWKPKTSLSAKNTIIDKLEELEGCSISTIPRGVRCAISFDKYKDIVSALPKDPPFRIYSTLEILRKNKNIKNTNVIATYLE